MIDLNNRWFNGQPIHAELSPVTDFREACCRQYEMGWVLCDGIKVKEPADWCTNVRWFSILSVWFLFNRECTRGGFCNFMHLKPISRELRRELYGRRKKGYNSIVCLTPAVRVFVLLWCNPTPFSPPQPPQVSLKGKTISLKRKRKRQGQRGPRPRQAPLQRQTAFRAILTCRSWLIVLHFTCQPKAFIKFVPFQIHLCMNYFFLWCTLPLNIWILPPNCLSKSTQAIACLFSRVMKTILISTVRWEKPSILFRCFRIWGLFTGSSSCSLEMKKKMCYSHQILGEVALVLGMFISSLKLVLTL